jgi:hypothetical protein
MEDVICDRGNIGDEICDEELPPLEDITSDVCNASAPIPYDVTGRRIIDFTYFFSKIKEIDNHNKVMGCSISNCFVITETRYGLRSRYILKCNMCNSEFVLKTEDEDNNCAMDVNTASVAGAMAIGVGHSQLHELLSSMEIPVMSATTYSIYHDKLAKGWEDTALDEMKAAALQEIEYAIAEGQVTPDGTPILTVVADGSWAKRSYRTNYNSLSGVVSRTIYKVLYITSCTRQSERIVPGSSKKTLINAFSNPLSTFLPGLLVCCVVCFFTYKQNKHYNSHSYVKRKFLIQIIIWGYRYQFLWLVLQ